MASAAERVSIRGLREVQLSMARYDRGILKAASKAAYLAAKLVMREARSLWDEDRRTAMGFVPSVRGPQAKVKQRIGPTTGLRGDFGALQMRTALLPALYRKRGEALALYETSFELLKKEAGL